MGSRVHSGRLQSSSVISTPAAIPPNPTGLYAIVDDQRHASPAALVEAAVAAERAGSTWIQLRLKRLCDRDRYEVASRCCERLASRGRNLWIDDCVELAALLPLRGVHLGQQDLPPRAARSLLPGDRLVGRSTHDLRQLAAADADPEVDVVAIGPILPTGSKQSPDPAVGWEVLRDSRHLTTKPLIAIGGLGPRSYAEARGHGADLVASIGALGGGEEFERRCLELVEIERRASWRG
ncbi:MAG: thiamine phosphate synthase [Acidobacteria bacterium]|nr:MAG: thiamine phosphate synthase [Acidobacteriota bacterium]